MKKLFHLSAIIFLLAVCLQSRAQQYTFVILDEDDVPITNAKIIAAGEEHFSGNDGKIIYKGEDDITRKNARVVDIKVLSRYVTVKAANYKAQTIDLSKYPVGSTITVRLVPLPPELKAINIYVKDKKGNPVKGAYILVNPGQSTSTDMNGYAQGMHRQIIGEYVTIRVSADGYKAQQQSVMTGEAQRIEGSIRVPAATVYFTLEPGENEATIFHINVEVLDEESNQPVEGASVQLNISDGTSQSGNTNGKGEIKFSDLEHSYKGTSARVAVTKPGYKEKWSDITEDMMTGKDNSERQFLVYLTKKEKDTQPVNVNSNGSGIAGTWIITQGDETAKMIISTQPSGAFRAGTINWSMRSRAKNGMIVRCEVTNGSIEFQIQYQQLFDPVIYKASLNGKHMSGGTSTYKGASDYYGGSWSAIKL